MESNPTSVTKSIIEYDTGKFSSPNKSGLAKQHMPTIHMLLFMKNLYNRPKCEKHLGIVMKISKLR